MKKKIQKGEIGYWKSRRKREWIKTLLLFLTSFLMLITGMLVAKHMNPDISWSDSRKNLLTVAAVLGVLPASRCMISAIMFTRACKHSCPRELYERLKAFEEKLLLAFEICLTAEKGTYPLHAVLCCDGEILGLLDGDAAAAKQGEEHLKQMLIKDGKKNVTVKLYTDSDAFIARVERAGEAGENGHALLELLYQISL